MAGAKADGSDFNWVKNGIPLAVVNQTDGENNNNVNAGAMVVFNKVYNNDTIDKYDEASDGVGINFTGYGMIWFDALALLNA